MPKKTHKKKSKKKVVFILLHIPSIKFLKSIRNERRMDGIYSESFQHKFGISIRFSKNKGLRCL